MGSASVAAVLCTRDWLCMALAQQLPSCLHALTSRHAVGNVQRLTDCCRLSYTAVRWSENKWYTGRVVDFDSMKRCAGLFDCG